MGGSTPAQQTTTTKSDPWEPQQEYILAGLEEARKQFLGPEANNITPDTNVAYDRIRQRATDGSPINEAAQQTALDTISGQHLFGGTAFNRALEAAENRIIPQISSQFASQGAYGSPMMQSEMARVIGDSFANQYGQERALQQQAMLSAPQIAAQDYYDAEQLRMLGSLQENRGRDLVSRYLPLVSANYGGTTTQTSFGQTGGNPFMSALGTGLSVLPFLF